MTSAAGFATWVGRLLADEASSTVAGASPRGCRFRWIVDADRVLGGIAARWGDTDTVRRFGHVGYGVTPSARGRGVATAALGTVVGELAGLGVSPVLLVCADGNAASAATIEHNGGRLEGVRRTEHGAVRRYRIGGA